MMAFRRFLSPVLLWYIAMTLLLYVLMYMQVLRNYLAVPEGRYYYGGEEYPLDLSQNIAHIRQEYEGGWQTFFNNSTLLPLLPSWLKFEYILIGKFAKVFSLDPVLGHMSIRGLVSIVWLSSSHFGIQVVSKRLITI
ncbi:MAG: hypothetical protein N3A54_03730 [Patescibacteria group bacterium]|nr:hypothetical protein [Patescibacteria group bacterium]